MMVLNILCLCVDFSPIGKIAAHSVYKKVSLYKNLIFFLSGCAVFWSMPTFTFVS